MRTAAVLGAVLMAPAALAGPIQSRDTAAAQYDKSTGNPTGILQADLLAGAAAINQNIYQATSQTKQQRQTVVRFSQATTASYPSSQAQFPEEEVIGLARSASRSSLPLLPDLDLTNGTRGDIAGGVAFGIGSSQVLLPDSLFDDIRKAPEIMDSEDDEDDEL